MRLDWPCSHTVRQKSDLILDLIEELQHPGLSANARTLLEHATDSIQVCFQIDYADRTVRLVVVGETGPA